MKGALVDATVARRRLQALAALGWPMAALAERTGASGQTMSALRRGGPRRIELPLDRAIAVAYDALQGTPGPHNRSRLDAMRYRWAPPLAWDDITDPNDVPSGARWPL